MFDKRSNECCGPWGHRHHHEGPGRGYDRIKGHPRLLGHPKLFLFPAILALLEEEPSHGYALLSKLTDLGFVPKDTSPTTVYRVLSRMEVWGLVEHDHVDEGQGPARKVYHLTEAGKQDLDAWSARLESTGAFLRWFEEKHPAPEAKAEG